METEPITQNQPDVRFVRFVAGQCFAASRGVHAAGWWGSRGIRTACWGRPLCPDWVRDAKAYSQADWQAVRQQTCRRTLRVLRRVLGVRTTTNGWRLSLQRGPACTGRRRRFTDILETLFAVLLSESPLSEGGVVCLHSTLRCLQSTPFSELRCAVSNEAAHLWVLDIRVGYAGASFEASAPGIARATRGWRRWIDSPELRQADYRVALRRDYARALDDLLRSLLPGNLAARVPVLCPYVQTLFQGRSTSQPDQVALSYVGALAKVHYKASRRARHRAVRRLMRLQWNE